MATITNRGFTLEAVLKTEDIPAHVANHLRRVYELLFCAVLSCALGAYSSLTFLRSFPVGLAHFLSLVLVIPVCLPRLVSFRVRLGSFLALAFSSGISLRGLLSAAISVDPSTVLLALVSTAVVFLCFTGAALLSRRRSFLYLGAVLSSALSLLVLAGFVNIFLRSKAVFSVQLYGGLFVFAGFLVFDTQMIVERASVGAVDVVQHSLDLFLDVLNVFVRVLTILTKLKKKGGNSDSSSKSKNSRR